MKVYAVIDRCEDEYYPDYRVVDERVYLKKKDAKKRLKELVEEQPYWAEHFEVYDFEVTE